PRRGRAPRRRHRGLDVGGARPGRRAAAVVALGRPRRRRPRGRRPAGAAPPGHGHPARARARRDGAHRPRRPRRPRRGRGRPGRGARRDRGGRGRPGAARRGAGGAAALDEPEVVGQHGRGGGRRRARARQRHLRAGHRRPRRPRPRAHPRGVPGPRRRAGGALVRRRRPARPGPGDRGVGAGELRTDLGRRPHGLRPRSGVALTAPLRTAVRLARLVPVIEVGRVLELARSGAEQAAGSARAVVALTRSGVIRPIRPDRLAGMVSALVRYGLTITAGYAAGAARHPDRTAIVDETGSLTFAEVATWTDAIARGLAASGVGPGTRVGLLCRNHRGAIAGQVAAGKLGADTVLLNVGLSATQLREVAAELRLHTVVADEE